MLLIKSSKFLFIALGRAVFSKVQVQTREASSNRESLHTHNTVKTISALCCPDLRPKSN